MSVSSWLVTALALRPPGQSLGHQIERPTTTPGRAASETRARARNEPRSLKTRTIAPSAMPRGAASPGWIVTLASPSRRTKTGCAENVEFRKWWAGGEMNASGYRFASSGALVGPSRGGT